MHKREHYCTITPSTFSGVSYIVWMYCTIFFGSGKKKKIVFFTNLGVWKWEICSLLFVHPYECVLRHDGPRLSPGPKLTCAVSLNSLWQSISSWWRHYYSAGGEPAERKHGNWHLSTYATMTVSIQPTPPPPPPTAFSLTIRHTHTNTNRVLCSLLPKTRN